MDLETIIQAVNDGRLNITDHADEELENDNIENEDLYYSVRNGEIIEDYPDDFPFPSFLIYGRDSAGRPIHSVWAYSDMEGLAILVTAYVPDPKRWINFRKRRK